MTDQVLLSLPKTIRRRSTGAARQDQAGQSPGRHHRSDLAEFGGDAPHQPVDGQHILCDLTMLFFDVEFAQPIQGSAPLGGNEQSAQIIVRSECGR